MQSAQSLSSVRQATGRFTQIANQALRDPRLSYRAKGILATALTHEAGFSFGRPWIDSHGTEGRDAITAAIAELKALGYCRSVRTKNDAGDWQGSTLVFTDDGATENPLPRNAATENAATENGATENPSLLKKTIRRTPLERKPLEENQLEAPVAGKTAHDPTPQDRPPLANVVDASKGESSERRSTTDRRDSIPSEFHAHTDDLTYWLERRKLKNPRAAKLAVWGPRTRSAGALRKAIAAGVVKPYLEQAAEAGWASLGFAGYEEVIAKLSGKGSSFGGRPEPAALRPYVMSS